MQYLHYFPVYFFIVRLKAFVVVCNMQISNPARRLNLELGVVRWSRIILAVFLYVNKFVDYQNLYG